MAGRKIAEVSPEHYRIGESLEEMNRVEYTYDLMDRMTGKIDKYIDPVTNQWVTVTSKVLAYDQNGNVTKEQDALGVDGNYGTEYTYDLANIKVTVLDPESQDRGLPYTAKYTYDGLGRKISETNAKGISTIYTYNDAGKVEEVKVNGQILRVASYDLIGNVLTQTDGNGNVTKYEYNALGKLRKMVSPGDVTVPENTTTYQFDLMGNVSNSQDTTGKLDIYTYDNQGRQTSRTQQKSDGTEAISTSIKYDKNGNQRFVKDGRQNETEYIYDDLSRLKAKKIAVSGIVQTTSYDYDANGNQTTVTDWRGNITKSKYDPLNRLIAKDDANNKVILKLKYNKNNAQVASYDALNNMIEYTYDKNNRLLSTIDAEIHTTSQTYDNVGNINTKTDGRRISTTYNYDQFNRLVSVVDPKTVATSYTYDLNGNLLTQKDGNGNITTWEYNVINKVVKKIDQGGRTGTPGNYVYSPAKNETYTYYADGNIATKKDRNGNITTYIYDIHGRLRSQSIGSASISYTYDNNGNQLTMTDSTGTTVRTYDELNRTLTKSVPNIGTSNYRYDIITGLPTGYTAELTTDPKGNTTQKVLDRVGRLRSVTADGATTTYNYYDNGNRQNVIYPDGSREDYTYYGDNLNQTLTNKKADGTVIDTYSYIYDGAHNQTSKTDKKGTTEYTYDSLNRLETVTDPPSTTSSTTKYNYDRAGNRLTEVVTKVGNTNVTIYAYNEQNRLTNTTSFDAGATKKVTYNYDNNGNLISSVTTVVKTATPGAQATVAISAPGQTPSKDITFNQYDVWNQLVKTTVGSNTVTNAYYGDGYRASKTVNGETKRYLYEYDHVVLEVDGQGNESARNVYGTNLLQRTDSGQSYYYMYNGHGDVTALLTTDGQIPATYYYDAFGNITEQTVTGDVYQPVKYAGYIYDDETGYYYLNARYYDPDIARFLSEDTYPGQLNDPLSLNLYSYCSNNPIMYTDPTGHWQETDKNLDQKSRIKISVLTDVYYSTKDANVKKQCASEAQKVRDNAKITNEFSKVGDAYNKELKQNSSVTASDWLRISNTYSGSTTQNAITSISRTMSSTSKLYSYKLYQTSLTINSISGLVSKPSSTPQVKSNTNLQGTSKTGMVLSKEIDLGQGWRARKDKGSESTGTQDHTHVWNPKKGKWAQNEDGSVHDEHSNGEGSPPGWVQKELKKKFGWDWGGKTPIIPIPALAAEEGLAPAFGGFIPLIIPTKVLDDYMKMFETGFAQPT